MKYVVLFTMCLPLNLIKNLKVLHIFYHFDAADNLYCCYVQNMLKLMLFSVSHSS